MGAWDGDTLAGVVAFLEGWIDQLYVLPDRQGRGIGRAPLACAVSGQTRVRLWTFKKKAGAPRYYERNGFVVIEETDGSLNEECEPGVLFEWRRP